MGRFQNSIDSSEAFALALIPCDRIIIDQDRGDKTIVGAFDTLVIDVYPAVIAHLSVHISIARGLSQDDTFYIALISPAGDLVMGGALQVPKWSELGIADFALSFYRIVLPTPGVYVLRLSDAGQRVLLERPFVLRKPPESPGAEDQGQPTP